MSDTDFATFLSEAAETKPAEKPAEKTAEPDDLKLDDDTDDEEADEEAEESDDDHEFFLPDDLRDSDEPAPTPEYYGDNVSPFRSGSISPS